MDPRRRKVVAGQEQVRAWRVNRQQGDAELDAYAETLNEAVGTHIDARTSRMLRQRGRYVREVERRLS